MLHFILSILQRRSLESRSHDTIRTRRIRKSISPSRVPKFVDLSCLDRRFCSVQNEGAPAGCCSEAWSPLVIIKEHEQKSTLTPQPLSFVLPGFRSSSRLYCQRRTRFSSTIRTSLLTSRLVRRSMKARSSSRGLPTSSSCFAASTDHSKDLFSPLDSTNSR